MTSGQYLNRRRFAKECSQAFGIEFRLTVIGANTILLLFDIGELGVAVTRDVGMVGEGSREVLNAVADSLILQRFEGVVCHRLMLAALATDRTCSAALVYSSSPLRCSSISGVLGSSLLSSVRKVR